MRHSTTDTYQLKREILIFSNRLSHGAFKDQQKFAADMIYGILGARSCVLSRVADVLQEEIRKKNTIERLSRKLTEDVDPGIHENYLSVMRGLAKENPPVFVDDSEVIKPYGKAFEALGLVRDGSDPDHAIQKGYHVTEIAAITGKRKQPFSLFSHIHSSHEKDYVSANAITYAALEKTMAHFPDSTYVFDRGYDMNGLFRFMYKNEGKFIVRLTERRKVFFKGRWYKSTTLRDSRKGKLKGHVMFDGKETECWFTCLNAQITQGKRNMRLILVYGLSDTPMMLVTNLPVKSKEDVQSVVRTYFMRWRIEEYFRFKKNHFDFEGFRVRSLKAMNALNHYLSYAIGLLCLLSEKKNSSILRMAVTCAAKALKDEKDISFTLYRFGLGVFRLLAQAREGIRKWFHIGRPKYRQLTFPLLC